MRFIAVFTQRTERYGIGFETLVDASDFLFWGYEDNDLIPDGIYDIMTAEVTLYEHIDQIISHSDSETIRRFAAEYVDHMGQHVAAANR